MSDHHAEITRRWRDLAAVAAGIIPTKLPLDPMPSEILSVTDDLDILCDAVDALVEAYGAYVESASGYRIQPKLMRRQLFGALDGNMLYEIEQAASKVSDDLHAAVA